MDARPDFIKRSPLIWSCGPAFGKLHIREIEAE